MSRRFAAESYGASNLRLTFFKAGYETVYTDSHSPGTYDGLVVTLRPDGPGERLSGDQRRIEPPEPR